MIAKLANILALATEPTIRHSASADYGCVDWYCYGVTLSDTQTKLPPQANRPIAVGVGGSAVITGDIRARQTTE